MSPKTVPAKSQKGKATASSEAAAATAGGAPTQAPTAPAIPLISVRYSNAPLTFQSHFGHEGGEDMNVAFGMRQSLPVIAGRSKERLKLVTEATHTLVRAFVSDCKFETTDRKSLKKPEFLFGDAVELDVKNFYDGDYKMLRRMDDRHMFLPNMQRMFPLSYYQSASVPRRMEWELVKNQDGVSLGELAYPGFVRAVGSRHVTGLRPGLFSKEYPVAEVAAPARVFIRGFIGVKGEFPAADFRAPGWVHSTGTTWWARLVNFVSQELGDLLVSSHLGVPIMATQFGIIQNSYNFFAMLEKYNPETCTFFTPVGELGFALHEMYEVSGLPFGEVPYEEFVPGTEELAILRSASPDIYETFWEVMCHFHTCIQITGSRGGGVKQKSWADYLFKNLDNKDAVVTRLTANSSDEVAHLVVNSTTYVNEAQEDIFPAFTEFQSFHYQTLEPISDTALFAGFLMLWLKRCIVPSRPIDSIAAEVVYPAVLLAHGRPINLLTATVCCLQSGLRELASDFLQVKEVGPKGKKSLKMPNPRVPLPYTYLVAWYVLHCPALMSAAAPSGNHFVPWLQRLQASKWEGWYMVMIRKIISRDLNYHVFRCYPEFDGSDYGEMYQDVRGPNSFTQLNGGVFRWLINIRPGYLVFRQGSKCFIEPYQPFRFSRQFGYDQLYVGNPNPQLALIGNPYEGARAWYYSVAGCTGASFKLPHKTPNCYMTMGFCNWYHSAHQIPEYNINSSCLKDIRRLYELKKGSKMSRMKGLDEYMACEQGVEANTGVETTVAGPDERAPTEVRTEKVKGKRPMSAEEARRDKKRARRQLSVDSPTSPTKGGKLMQSAFQAASPQVPLSRVVVEEEEGEESSVVGISHQQGLRSTGPALMGSQHSSGDEGGDETGDAESIPRKETAEVTIPGLAPSVMPQSFEKEVRKERMEVPASGSGAAEFSRTIGYSSPASSDLLPRIGAERPSPTTGLLPVRVTAADSPHPQEDEEQLSYGTDSADKAWDEVQEGGDDEDTSGKAAASDKATTVVITSSSASPTKTTTAQEVAITPLLAGSVQEVVAAEAPHLAPGTVAITTPPPTRSTPLVISLRPGGVVSTRRAIQTESPATPSLGPLVHQELISSPAALLEPRTVPTMLQRFIGELEFAMRETIQSVVTGDGSFEAFKPILMNYLNNVRYMGDTESILRCTANLNRLEEDLKSFEDLKRAELETEVESVFSDIRAEAMSQYEAAQKSLTEQEAQVITLRGRYDNLQGELTASSRAVQITREAIAHLRTRLAREEAVVKDLTQKNVEAFNDYRVGVQALEEAKKKAAIAVPDEAELRKQVTQMVWAAHEQKLSDIKSRLASIDSLGR